MIQRQSGQLFGLICFCYQGKEDLSFNNKKENISFHQKVETYKAAITNPWNCHYNTTVPHLSG